MNIVASNTCGVAQKLTIVKDENTRAADVKNASGATCRAALLKHA
jgi:hypothetical protein